MNTCSLQVPAGSANSYRFCKQLDNRLKVSTIDPSLRTTIRAFEIGHHLPFPQEIHIKIKMGRDGRRASKFDK